MSPDLLIILDYISCKIQVTCDGMLTIMKQLSPILKIKFY